MICQNKMAKMMQKSLVLACLLAIYVLDICVALDKLMPQHARVHKFTMDQVSEGVESHTVDKRSTRHKRAAVDSRCQRQAQLLKEIKPEDLIDKVSRDILDHQIFIVLE